MYNVSTSGQGSQRPVTGAAARSSGVSIEDMNQYISATLCNSLLPVWTAKQRYVCIHIHVHVLKSEYVAG